MMKRVDVSVTAEQHERLRQIAFEHGSNIRAVVTGVTIALVNGEIEIGSKTVTVERQEMIFGMPATKATRAKSTKRRSSG